MTYIYILSDENQIRYVGKTKYITKRYRSHMCESKKKRTHKEKWINKVLLEGGKISIQIIDVCDDEISDEVETYWIWQFKSWGFDLVNLTPGGGGGNSMLGKKLSDETKKKMSQSAKLRGQNIAGWNKGLKMSPEFRKKISEVQKGRILSDETRKKISEKLKGVKKQPMSEETKLKISEQKKGKISHNKGKVFGEETRKKMSLAKLGVKKDDRTKKTYSESKKIIWKIKNPNGDISEFLGYDSFKKYVLENSLDVSVTTLKAYGKNKGWEVIEKIKKNKKND
jgi:group I intron endonuclease